MEKARVEETARASRLAAGRKQDDQDLRCLEHAAVKTATRGSIIPNTEIIPLSSDGLRSRPAI